MRRLIGLLFRRRAVLAGGLAAAATAALPGVAALAEGCSGTLPEKITFQVRRKEPNEANPFSPYIHLADPEQSLGRLMDADAVVVPCPRIVVVVDYPLKDEFKFPLTAANGSGFTRAELARAVAGIYQRIYREEAATTRVPVVPPDKRVGLANRNRTDGTYGIWGHDLEDLDLSTIVPELRDGVVYVSLEIDS